jgi:hypothetical protein
VIKSRFRLIATMNLCPFIVRCARRPTGPGGRSTRRNHNAVESSSWRVDSLN